MTILILHIPSFTFLIMPSTHHRFVFVLFDGFSNLVLASALEPLRAAAGLPGGPEISWDICTIDGSPATSSSDLVITPKAALNAIPDPTHIDYLVVISGYDMRHHLSSRTRARLQNAAQHARTVIGVDTAAWLLASCNMLAGKSATIHWQELDQFREQFPDVTVLTDRFVEDGKMITSGGAATVMEMMLHILARQYGPAVAFDVSNLFVYDARHQRHGDPNISGRGADRLHGPGADHVRRAVAEMISHIETPVALKSIAIHAGCSLRSLDRAFQDNLQMAPGKYYQMLRLGRARDLARSTDMKLADIALQTGFKSHAALSRAYAQAFGTTLRAMRSKRRPAAAVGT
ncbi:GlxA family transcriptional regulator [Thalassospira profundimaris]|uniref:GlxA family transcriptional regulator n=1 Tax=Thalassospira profundimaris TaxID=502049 RepID=UPI00028718B2|nr:GlxA family transcriptional regulator [Thalassospira profundimaris]EKF08574.1 transcriptional regulator [Thalassospira profundimaris WP0211]